MLLEYEFRSDQLEGLGYRVFPNELENNPNVLFHATSIANLAAILNNGILPGNEVGQNLMTISYADNSMIALTHWVGVRREGQDGVILALLFPNLDETFISEGTRYSMQLRVQPCFIGKCVVPSSYNHH